MELLPEGLSKDQFAILSKGTEVTERQSWDDLLSATDKKLAEATAARRNSAYVNLPLAEALVGRIRAIHDRWDDIPGYARPWCKGVVHYFLEDGDSLPDYSSPIGFEDDVDVLNACVRLADMPDLVLDPEDFDYA